MPCDGGHHRSWLAGLAVAEENGSLLPFIKSLVLRHPGGRIMLPLSSSPPPQTPLRPFP
jgi:hypothetical protein